MAFEAGIWTSLARWTLRRSTTEEGARYPYLSTTAGMLWLWIIASGVEVVTVHLLLARWLLAQGVLLVIGLWGLLWMLGLRASLVMHPHLLADDALRVRHGATTDIRMPWRDVAEVSARVVNHEGSRALRVHQQDGATTVQVVMGNQTNIDVQLHDPLDLPTPDGTVRATRLNLWVDDPGAFLTAARARTTTPTLVRQVADPGGRA